MEKDDIIIEDEDSNTVLDKSMVEVDESKMIDKTSEHAISEYAKTGLQGVQSKFESGELSGSDAGKEIAHVMMTSKALTDTEENKDFLDKFKSTKQEELIESAKKELLLEQSKKIAAKQTKAEAFYVSFRPILEFDLDHMLVKNAPKKVKYKKVFNKDTGKNEKVIVSEEENKLPERPKHTYEERSYGIPLMVAMLLVLTIPYFICTVILSIFNAINYVFVAISRFTKPAFYLCAGVAGILLVGVFTYVIILSIQAIFGVTIIPKL